MTMRIKCTCETTFCASDHIVADRLQCPACGTRWPVPQPIRAVVQRDDAADYALCPRCASVRTLGGVVCESCVYEMHTGRKFRKGWGRWVMPAAIAGAAMVVAMVWLGLAM